MKFKIIALTVCGLGVATAVCLNSMTDLVASKIEWKSFMGKQGSDESNIYTLMGQGFMGWPGMGGPNFPKELDAEVADWVKEHPKAAVVPVRKLPLSDEFAFTYVWLVHGEENLNLNLVRKGLCDSQNMMVEGDELLVEKATYEQFRAAVLNAEQLAIKDKVGVWAKPGMEGEAHWKKAELLENQGKLQDAIAEYQAVADSDESKASSSWYRMGKLHEQLGQPEAALKAYDRAIATATHEIESRFAQMEKARLLASQGKTDATSEVYGDLGARCVEDLTPCLDAASALVGTNPGKAMEVLEGPLLKFVSKNEIVFDGDSVRFDPEMAKRSDRYWMALHEASHAFIALSNICLQRGDLDKTLAYSAKGISIKQNTWGAMAEQLDLLTMEAADYRARLVRARAYTTKREFEGAKRELDYAKVLVDTGQIQGGFVKQEMDQAYAELGKAFPDRQVNVPSQYKPASKARPKEYSPAELKGMTEDDLVVLAAGPENGAAYAALEELVSRNKRSALSEQTTKRLIADGLSHQSKLKAGPVSRRTPSSFWRAQYGVFIEDALTQKKLSDEDRTRYLRNMLGISIDVSSPRESGSPNLPFSLETDPRVADSIADRGSAKTNWTGTIRIEGGFIDGKPVSIEMRGSDDNIETIGLSSGALGGRGCDAIGLESLTPGMHVLIVQGQIEIREGDLGFRTDPEDLAKIEPVIRYSFSASAEFVVEK